MLVLTGVRIKGLACVLSCCLTLSAQSTQQGLPADTTGRQVNFPERPFTSTPGNTNSNAAVIRNETRDNTSALSTVDVLPEPSKVVWWAAAIPGYGQILNKKYWKLPIVYAGFLGCYYAINWNSNRYLSYKNGYLDITDTDDATNSYLNLIPEGRTIDSFGGRQAFTGLLKSGMDQARYYRDLTVIISIAYYGLTIIDAFVDAHLADFDISPDLSMRMRPMIHREDHSIHTSFSGYTYGLSGRIKF